MYTPPYLLPRHDPSDRDKYFDRWHTKEGAKTHDKILEMIKAGAGEDFMQGDFQAGLLPPMEHEWDLRGIWLGRLEIDFPQGDNFEAIDFSYAVFNECKFRRAVFVNSYFGNSKIQDSEFHNCAFAFMGAYCTSFRNVKFINCDFSERFAFTNSTFENVQFVNCFFNQPVFRDCKFDEGTVVEGVQLKSQFFTDSTSFVIPKSDLAEIYKGIKEAYKSGDVTGRMRQFFVKEKQCVTRYNRKGLQKLEGFIVEFLAGYGVRPLNTLFAALVSFALFTSPYVFYLKMPLWDAVVFSAGAFLSFGYRVEVIRRFSQPMQFLYVAEAFVGIFFCALFVTVLARYWFEER